MSEIIVVKEMSERARYLRGEPIGVWLNKIILETAEGIYFITDKITISKLAVIALFDWNAFWGGAEEADII